MEENAKEFTVGLVIDNEHSTAKSFMPVADLNVLSKPLSGAQPSGENLEYDPRFVAVVDASFPSAERQYGDTLLEAE